MKSRGDPGVTRRGSAKSKGWGRQPVRERSHWQRPRPIKMAYYRPQRSWAKVMFLQASVILSTGGGCLPQCMLGCQPPRDQRPTPPTRQTPPGTRDPSPSPRPGRHPPGPEAHPPDQRPTPRPGRHPPDQADPPGPGRPPPPREADASIRSMSGRYASYWNAFLCTIMCRCSYCTGVTDNIGYCNFDGDGDSTCHACVRTMNPSLNSNQSMCSFSRSLHYFLPSFDSDFLTFRHRIAFLP